MCDVVGRERNHESLEPAVRQSLFHCGLCHGPIRASSRMIKKSASSGKAEVAAALLTERRVLARRGWAGEKSGHFEHPAQSSPVVLDLRTIELNR